MQRAMWLACAKPASSAITFPESRGICRVPQAKLFFPEELPGLIAEEAQRLWRNG